MPKTFQFHLFRIFLAKNGYFPFTSIENVTKDTWQVFPVLKIFPLSKKSPGGKNLPSGKSCKLNQNDFLNFIKGGTGFKTHI